MARDAPLALPMPLLHALAAGLPGLGYAALAGRGSFLLGRPVGGLTWRQVTLAGALSIAVAASIAVYVESVGGAYTVVLLLVHNGAFEAAQNAGDVFDAIADADIILTEDEQFIAGLVTAAVLAPLAEEFAKSLAVRFTMTAGTTRAQAFFLGAVAGAAFGLLEAMLYGLAGVEDDAGGWWSILLLRAGSTSLHALCSGLAGLAWWYWSLARGHRAAIALFSLAMALHALWNGVFTVIESRIFGLEALSDRTLEAIAYAIVAVAAAAMVLAIPLVARRLREPAAAAEAVTARSEE
jgi:RsiW-degrading membrane proteinase PrsW (M82 family)